MKSTEDINIQKEVICKKCGTILVSAVPMSYGMIHKQKLQEVISKEGVQLQMLHKPSVGIYNFFKERRGVKEKQERRCLGIYLKDEICEMTIASINISENNIKIYELLNQYFNLKKGTDFEISKKVINEQVSDLKDLLEDKKIDGIDHIIIFSNEEVYGKRMLQHIGMLFGMKMSKCYLKDEHEIISGISKYTNHLLYNEEKDRDHIFCINTKAYGLLVNVNGEELKVMNIVERNKMAFPIEAEQKIYMECEGRQTRELEIDVYENESCERFVNVEDSILINKYKVILDQKYMDKTPVLINLCVDMNGFCRTWFVKEGKDYE